MQAQQNMNFASCSLVKMLPNAYQLAPLCYFKVNVVEFILVLCKFDTEPVENIFIGQYYQCLNQGTKYLLLNSSDASTGK